jgi:hypothetical protein
MSSGTKQTSAGGYGVSRILKTPCRGALSPGICTIDASPVETGRTPGDRPPCSRSRSRLAAVYTRREVRVAALVRVRVVCVAAFVREDWLAPGA